MKHNPAKSACQVLTSIPQHEEPVSYIAIDETGTVDHYPNSNTSAVIYQK